MSDDLCATLRDLLHDDDTEALAEWLDEVAEECPPDLPELVRCMQAEDQLQPLLWLLLGLSIHGHPDALDALRPALRDLSPWIQADLRDEAPEVRRGAARLAGALRLAALAPVLIDALEDPYFLTRMEAARALGRLRHAPAIPELRLSLRDTDSLTQLAALEALIQIPDPDLQTAYLGHFREDPPEYVIGILDDASVQVRREALRLLRDAPPEVAVAVLEQHLGAAEELPSPEEAALLDDARRLLQALRTAAHAR